MNHIPLVIHYDQKEGIKRVHCECGIKHRFSSYAKLSLSNGCNCSSTAEFLYEHMAQIPMMYTMRFYPNYAIGTLKEIRISNPRFDRYKFDDIKRSMKREDNMNTIWFFEDIYNDHVFLVLN